MPRFDPPGEIIGAGPYRHVCYLIYVDGLMVLIGFGLFNQWVPVLLFTLLMAFVVHELGVCAEKAGLEGKSWRNTFRYDATLLPQIEPDIFAKLNTRLLPLFSVKIF